MKFGIDMTSMPNVTSNFLEVKVNIRDHLLCADPAARAMTKCKQ